MCNHFSPEKANIHYLNNQGGHLGRELNNRIEEYREKNPALFFVLMDLINVNENNLLHRHLALEFVLGFLDILNLSRPLPLIDKNIYEEQIMNYGEENIKSILLTKTKAFNLKPMIKESLTSLERDIKNENDREITLRYLCVIFDMIIKASTLSRE